MPCELQTPAAIRSKIDEAELRNTTGVIARAWLIVGIREGSVPASMVPMRFRSRANLDDSRRRAERQIDANECVNSAY